MGNQSNFLLARNLCVAFLAAKLRIQLSTADKRVTRNPEELAADWYRLAEDTIQRVSVMPPDEHEGDGPVH